MAMAHQRNAGQVRGARPTLAPGLPSLGEDSVPHAQRATAQTRSPGVRLAAPHVPVHRGNSLAHFQ